VPLHGVPLRSCIRTSADDAATATRGHERTRARARVVREALAAANLAGAAGVDPTAGGIAGPSAAGGIAGVGPAAGVMAAPNGAMTSFTIMRDGYLANLTLADDAAKVAALRERTFQTRVGRAF